MLTKQKYRFLFEKAKTIRKRKGYSLEQVAKYLAKTRQAVSLWEQGKRNPGKSEIILIARLYNIEVNEIAHISNSGFDSIFKEDTTGYSDDLNTLPPDIKETVIHLRNREKRLENERRYLRKENRRLKSIVNTVNSMIYTKDSKNNFMFINDRYLEVLGIPASEILGKNNYSIFSKTDADTLTSLEKTVFKSSIPIVKHQLNIPGTNDLHGKISINPIFDSGGNISGISVNIEDNTLEKELSERRILLEEITNQLDEFVWIRTITPFKKLLYISKGAENVLGYKLYELYNTYDIWKSKILSEDKNELIDFFNKKNSSQHSFKYSTNGEDVKWINYKKYIKTIDNKTIEFGIAQDITSKHDEEIRREMLEFVINNSPYGEWLEEILPDGTVESVYFNKSMEQNWGRPLELLKKSTKFGWLKYLHPEDRKCRAKENINKTRTSPVQFRVIMPDKSVKWLEEVYFVKKTNRGSLLRCGHQWDITESKTKKKTNDK